MGDKLNTAEFDLKGRCVRHPAIRLRKKKVFGGWKILIGHCPECCLDEMRRVRDEIGAEQDDDRDGERRRRKEKKKKRSDRDRDRDRDRGDKEHRRRNRTSNEDVSEVGSEGDVRATDGGGSGDGDRGGHRGGGHHGGRGHHRAPHRDGESDATGSTAQNSSMDGTGSVVSEQYVPRYQQHHHHGAGREAYYQQPPPPGPHPGHHHPAQPPPPQRTMVLSMAFTDPQTGQRGTYTGQVNSINHKPDGKGTVYYANGSIAEGTWMNGMLVESEDDNDGGYMQRGRGEDFSGDGGGNYPPPPDPDQPRSRSLAPPSRGDPPLGGERQSSRSRGSRSRRGDSAPPPPPPPSGNGAPFTGNLERLDQLGGVRSRRTNAPLGASASVQSYNSRSSANSHHGLAHMNMPSGSASVQDYASGPAYGSASVGGIVGSDYRRGESGFHRQQQSQSFHGRNPPGYR